MTFLSPGFNDMPLQAIDVVPSTEPRVFVVQLPMRLAQDTKELVPSVDLSPAEKFGRLVYCLDWPEIKAMDVPAMYRKLCNTLADYTEHDYILLAGNPVAGLIVAMACHTLTDSGVIRVLNWARAAKEYQEITIDIEDFVQLFEGHAVS